MWSDWGQFDPNWRNSSSAAQFADEIQVAVKEQYGESKLLLIKDPRICRFFTPWRHAIEQMEILSTAVLVVRHPLEVAYSLKVRNGFCETRSLLIWLRHTLDAERDTRSIRRAVVNYQELLKNWKSVAKHISEELRIVWPRPASKARAKD